MDMVAICLGVHVPQLAACILQEELALDQVDCREYVKEQESKPCLK